MARMRDLAGRLREQENALSGGYAELQDSAEREVEKRLASKIGELQRLQVASLDLLAEGVNDQFQGLGRVTGEDINLREGPGGKYPLLARLAGGELVVILGFNGHWVQVAIPRGPSGYVFKDYVQQETAT